MNKINFQENESNGLSCEEIFKNFFKQVYQKKEKEAEYINNSTAPIDIKIEILDDILKRKLNNISVVNLTVDPRIRFLCAYCVCSNEEIKKLLEFEPGYLTVDTSVVKINKLIIHKAMKFKVHNIVVNEKCVATKLKLCIVEENDLRNSAEYAKDVIIAQDKLACAKTRLDFYDAKF